MPKKAAIYIRTSSEEQSKEGKASPEEQENDAKEYIKKRGYKLVGIYSDTKKYRTSSGKLVEPSATRSDRPELNRLLKDIDNNKIDIIVCWREDRLYRGANRAMVEVNERVRNSLMNIELVKETYDPSTAPVKAWAAGIELEAKRQRMIMGIRHKLKQGKVRARSVLYGYQKNKNDFAELNDDEWPWVNKIWKWYSEGMSVTEIRNRLIAGNAPQRNKVQIPWRKSYIYRLLNIDTYHTGIQIYEWGGEIFELPYPIIVNEETVKRVIKIRNRRKQHPIRNVKHNYLSMALIYCDHCGIKLKSRSIYNLTYYSCDYGLQGYSSEGCCKTVRSDKIDNLLWQKVLELLQKDTIENAIEEKIKTLKVQEFDAKKEITNIEDVLINLKEERKWIITRARKKIITEEDMIEQLSLIRSQEESLKKELYDAKLVLENNVDHLSELIDTFRKNVWKGIEKLKQEPETEEEKNKQFQVKRKIVETIVKRINVFKDKSIEVKFIIDVRDKSLSPRLNYLEFSIFSLPFS